MRFWEVFEIVGTKVTIMQKINLWDQGDQKKVLKKFKWVYEEGYILGVRDK